MRLVKVIENYEILTKESVLNVEETESLFNEQNEILKKMGLDYSSTVGAHFIKSKWDDGKKCAKDTLGELTQCLAVKDGADLVRFENGNLGFVAYYNGTKNGFEIIHVF